MRLLAILLIISVNVYGQADTTEVVILPKPIALHYYEQAKVAMFLQGKVVRLEKELSLTNTRLEEKTIQLSAMNKKLDGEKLAFSSLNIKYDVATKDVQIAKITIKRLRRTKVLFVVTTCVATTAAGWLAYQAIKD